MFKKDAPHFYPRANSYTSYVVEYVTGAEAVDEYTLKLTFSKPYAEWERMTLQSWGEPMMVSPTQVKKLGNEKFANGPVGTGPFANFSDRKSTRLNSSHSQISYAVFCLKKKQRR